MLIENGADVNLRNSVGSVPLQWAASRANIVKMLIENGARVNLQNNMNGTAIHEAASEGNSLPTRECYSEENVL